MILIGDHTFPINAKTNLSRFHRQNIETIYQQIKVFKAIYRHIKIESNFKTIHRQIKLRFDRKFSESPPANLTFKRLFYDISSSDLNFERPSIHRNISDPNLLDPR